MKRIISFKSVALIFSILFIFIFLYSHYTSYIVTRKVEMLVDSVEFIQMSNSDILITLEELGYEIEMLEKDDIITITGKKNDSIISIKDSKYNKDFDFKNTERKITPMFEDVNWNDDMKQIKKLLGLNFLNTQFTDLHIPSLRTNIYADEIGILITAKEKNKFSMDLWADKDTESKLERIRVSYKK